MSEKFKITGLLHAKENTIKHSEKFQTRDFVLYVKGNDPKWDKYLPFTLKQLKCNLIDGIQKGTELTVEAYPGGRRWENPEGVMKYFADFTADIIQSTEIDINQSQFPSVPSASQSTDLPF